MKAIDRLFEYIEHKNFKHTRLEKDWGLSNGYLSQQRKREADLGEGILNKIIDNCVDLNPQWLLTGSGTMLKSYVEQRRELKNLVQDDVPVYYGNTRAGTVKVYNDDPDLQHPVGTLNAKLFPGCNHAEKVSGDSMYPLIINQGLIVGKVIDKSGIIWGEKYGLHTRFGMNVAKIVHEGSQHGLIKLVSYNQNIPVQEISLDDVTFCFRILFIINPA